VEGILADLVGCADVLRKLREYHATVSYRLSSAAATARRVIWCGV
jgi:hypothetical protein